MCLGIVGRSRPGEVRPPERKSSDECALRTHCRVVRVVTDGDGRTSGVEYVDVTGNWQIQAARTVILCGYTFENMWLLAVLAVAYNAF